MKCFLTRLLQPAGNEDEDDEDDENNVDAGLQQFQNQNTYSAIVPNVTQPQNMVVNTLARNAINSIGQGHGQMHPDIAYGHQGQKMFDDNQTSQLGLTDSNYMKAMLHGNFAHRRLPFGQSSQTSFQTLPDALSYGGEFTGMGYDDVGEPSLAHAVASACDPQLLLEPAALPGNGMADAPDTEPGPGGNSGSSTDSIDYDAGNADAPTSSGYDIYQEDEIDDDPSIENYEIEEKIWSAPGLIGWSYNGDNMGVK
ncbi:hypothetical protein LZ31DRAFT_597854 [Colletotrichum somersetense]|nr:hypothetical protein LZ31DRAFT_597854 [Colletotrichum somersetense]